MAAASRTPPRIVQSRHNARLKQLRAALTHPCAEQIGLEGARLVEEALRSGVAVEAIFVRAGDEDLLTPLLVYLDALHNAPELISVPEPLLQSSLSTDTPQGLAALAAPPAFALQQALGNGLSAPLIIVLAGVQDPGNVGTIVRSAEAFGATGVLALPGTCSIWNAKSLRAAMGSSFRLPVISLRVDDTFAWLAEHGVQSLAAVAAGQTAAARDLDLSQATALWIGNEGAGLSSELVARCGATVTVPCPGPVESLNAAIAASVLLYEASRQRGATP